MNKFTIYLISDLHVGSDEIFTKKSKLLKHIIASNSIQSNDVLVIAGDLTDQGTGKIPVLCCSCPNNINSSDQCDSFIKTVYSPLKTKIPNMLICHGNHDESSDPSPIVEFIKNEYDATPQGYYCRIINGVLFVVLGKYPSKDAIDFFETVRNVNKDKLPYIVIFHYQLDTQFGYDFWSGTEKETFLQYIKSVPNVITMLHGHIHLNYSGLFGGILTFCGSDLKGYYKITIDSGVVKEGLSIQI